LKTLSLEFSQPTWEADWFQLQEGSCTKRCRWKEDCRH